MTWTCSDLGRAIRGRRQPGPPAPSAHTADDHLMVMARLLTADARPISDAEIGALETWLGAGAPP